MRRNQLSDGGGCTKLLQDDVNLLGSIWLGSMDPRQCQQFEKDLMRMVRETTIQSGVCRIPIEKHRTSKQQLFLTKQKETLWFYMIVSYHLHNDRNNIPDRVGSRALLFHFYSAHRNVRINALGNL